MMEWTGQELIDWIKENHAENYRVRTYREQGSDLEDIEPELCKSRTYRFKGDGTSKIVEEYEINL